MCFRQQLITGKDAKKHQQHQRSLNTGRKRESATTKTATSSQQYTSISFNTGQQRPLQKDASNRKRHTNCELDAVGEDTTRPQQITEYETPTMATTNLRLQIEKKKRESSTYSNDRKNKQCCNKCCNKEKGRMRCQRWRHEICYSKTAPQQNMRRGPPVVGQISDKTVTKY